MSFSTALSGLAANNTALDVVGNNLANLNTTGFKADAIQFKDIMGQTSGSTEIGAGVATSGTSKQFTQGSIQPTSGALDAAIEGNGVFVLRNSSGSTLYTRAGSFKFDGTGTLVTATGEKVQGWTAVNGVLNTTGNTGDISITAIASQPPTATTKMTLTANLDASRGGQLHFFDTASSGGFARRHPHPDVHLHQDRLERLELRRFDPRRRSYGRHRRYPHFFGEWQSDVR